MYIELTEIDKSNKEIGEFILNTTDILYVDTYFIDEGKCKRVKLKDTGQSQFFIRHKDYEKIKAVLISNTDTEKM